MKKIACGFLCLLLFCAAMSGFSVGALSNTEAEISVKTAKTTYVPGEEISVTLNVNCGISLKSFNINLTYDKKVLQFNEAKTKHISGVNGDFQQYVYSDRLRITYSYKGSGTILSGDNSDAITLSFKVKETASAGTTSITPSAGTVVENNTSSIDKKPVINKSGATCKVTYNAARITVSAATSMKTNAKLSKLTVKNCTLQPNFDPDVTSYTLYVPENVSTITPKAETANTEATVKIDPVFKNNRVNKVNIKVTAADKTTTNTYVLTIKNGNPPSSSSSSSGSSSSSSSPATSNSSEESTVTTEPPSSEPSSNEPTSVDVVTSEPAPVAPVSEISSDASSEEPKGFFAALGHQAVTMVKHGPLMLILAGFVVLVLVLVALPLSKHKKRKYINELLRRGYIINPQINPMNGGMNPPASGGGIPPNNMTYRP